MANKKADFKLDEVTPDVINTCWICGRKFLATHIMANPICPKCGKTKKGSNAKSASVNSVTNDVSMKCEEAEKSLQKIGTRASVCYDVERGVYKYSNETGLWESADGEKWTKVEGTIAVDDISMDAVRGKLLADQMSKSPWGDLPPTQQKIHEIMEAMKDLLLYKNQKYGDSAISPKGIFYKGDSTNSILIRLDDKIGRIMSNTDEKPRVNDVADIIGYCTLLLISMGVTAEDIAKFKD